MSNGDHYPGSAESSQHFELTQQNIRDIGTLRSDVSGLVVGQHAMATEMRTGFQSLAASIQLQTKPKPQGQWVGVSGLVISITIILGLIVSFTMTTLKSGTDQLFAFMAKEIADHQSMLDSNMARMDLMDDKELIYATQRGAALARADGLAAKVDHLDDQRHIDEKDVLKRVSELEAKSERIYTAVQAEGDYMREHTNRDHQ